MVGITERGNAWLFVGLLSIASTSMAGDFDYIGETQTMLSGMRLPPDVGMFMLVFFRVVAVFVGIKGVTMWYDAANGAQSAQGGGGYRGALVVLLFAVLMFHINKVLAVISNSIPFLPNMTHFFGLFGRENPRNRSRSIGIAGHMPSE